MFFYAFVSSVCEQSCLCLLHSSLFLFPFFYFQSTQYFYVTMRTAATPYLDPSVHFGWKRAFCAFEFPLINVEF